MLSPSSIVILSALCGLALSQAPSSSIGQKYPAYQHEWSSMVDTIGLGGSNPRWVRPPPPPPPPRSPPHDTEFDSVRASHAVSSQRNPMDDALRILYSDVPMSGLVYQCFRSIPQRYRERCLFESFERFAGSVFQGKSRCCTKWWQIRCLEEYAYNSLYCNLHERVAVSRHFKKVRSLDVDGSPECRDYRPVDEEVQLWGSEAGRVPKCALGTKQELKV